MPLVPGLYDYQPQPAEADEAAPSAVGPVLPHVEEYWNRGGDVPRLPGSLPWGFEIVSDRKVQIGEQSVVLDDDMVAVLGLFMRLKGDQVRQSELPEKVPEAVDPVAAVYRLYLELDSGGRPLLSLHEPYSGSLDKSKWGLRSDLTLTDRRTDRPPRTSMEVIDQDIERWLSNPAMSVAWERAVSILPEAMASKLRAHYGAEDDRPRSYAEIAAMTGLTATTVKNKINLAKREIHTNLPSIADGTFDYTALNDRGREPNLLGLMASTGIAIPDDCDLRGLRRMVLRYVTDNDLIDARAKRLVVSYYGLDGKRPRSATRLGVKHRMTDRSVTRIVQSAVASLAEESYRGQAAVPDEAGPTVSASMRNQIESGASGLDIGLWFSEPGLRPVTERAMLMIKAQQAEILALRFGMADGRRHEAADIAGLLGIPQWLVYSNLTAAAERLPGLMAAIAAGTLDYGEWETHAGYPRSAMGLLAGVGKDISGESSVAGLKNQALAVLWTSGILSTEESRLMSLAYGLGHDGRPPDTAWMAGLYGVSPRRINQRIAEITGRLRDDNCGGRSKDAARTFEPVVSIRTLGRLGCYPVREHSIPGVPRQSDLLDGSSPFHDEAHYRERDLLARSELLELAKQLPDPRVGEHHRWLARAACRDADDKEVFFPISSADPGIAIAKAICAVCPVLAQCREALMARPDPHAIRAGITPDEYRQMQVPSQLG